MTTGRINRRRAPLISTEAINDDRPSRVWLVFIGTRDRTAAAAVTAISSLRAAGKDELLYPPARSLIPSLAPLIVSAGGYDRAQMSLNVPGRPFVGPAKKSLMLSVTLPDSRSFDGSIFEVIHITDFFRNVRPYQICQKLCPMNVVKMKFEDNTEIF